MILSYDKYDFAFLLTNKNNNWINTMLWDKGPNSKILTTGTTMNAVFC